MTDQATEISNGRSSASAQTGVAGLSCGQMEAIEALFAPYASSTAPGLVAGISIEGRSVYRRAFGLASLEHGTVNSLQTRMRIGSTGKHMAAMVALLLAEAGLLDIEAAITDYLPEVSTPDGRPTVAQLMNHTSGLRCAQELAFLAAGLTVQPPGRHLMAYSRQTASNFRPGEGQIYNNGAYHLLSIIIERVSGLPFEHAMQERLFAPLGLHQTSVLRSDLDLLPGMATLHFNPPGGGWRRGLFVNEENLGEGGVVSTLGDMLRWCACLRGDRPAGTSTGLASSWKKLTEPTRLKTGVTSRYGFGLWSHSYRGQDIVHHPGAVIGGNSQMLIVPQQKLDIVILTNSSLANSSALAYEAMAIVLGDELGALPRRPEMARLGHLAGQKYVSSDGLFFGFEPVGDLLGVSFLGAPAAPVFREDEDGWLRLLFEDAAMGPFEIDPDELSPAADGAATDSMMIREAGRPCLYRRVLTVNSIPEETAGELSGTYSNDEIRTSACVSWTSGKLRVQFQGVYGSRDLLLEAVSDRHFVATADDAVAPTRSSLMFSLTGRGGESFEINTNRTRRLKFSRCTEANNHVS